LTEVYPPATNQFGQTIWPIMMITVAHELKSGAALRPEFGAKYGEDNTSESEQIEALAKRIPPNSILLADAGYGIFRVCYNCIRAKQDVVFRLTNARFKSMKRNATLVSNEKGTQRFELQWSPSTKVGFVTDSSSKRSDGRERNPMRDGSLQSRSSIPTFCGEKGKSSTATY